LGHDHPTLHVTGLIHFAFALAAIASGPVVLRARKGTRFHRRAGWTYVVSMVGVNVTALMIYRLLGDFGPFHWAALFSLASVIAGVVPVRRRANRHWLKGHAGWMAGSYVGLCAALVAETTTRLAIVPFWWMVVASSLAVFAIGMLWIVRGLPAAIEGMRGVR